jgi:hypothetical protein
MIGAFLCAINAIITSEEYQALHSMVRASGK